MARLVTPPPPRATASTDGPFAVGEAAPTERLRGQATKTPAVRFGLAGHPGIGESLADTA